MSRKRERWPRPSANYGGFLVIDIPAAADVPPLHEMVEVDGPRADPRVELLAAVTRFVEATASGAGRREAVETLTREFVEKLVRVATAAVGPSPEPPEK
jgi:hypothetical protein